MSELGEKMEKAMGAAIEGVMREHEGSFVTKWVTVVEVIPEGGERGIWTFTSDDAKRWDIAGLLKELDTFQTAHLVVEILEDHRRNGDCE